MRAAQQIVEQPGEQRIRPHDAAFPVDRRDRHRGVMEEALRIGAVIARAVEHKGARGAGRAVGAERRLVEEPHRAACGRCES